MNTISTLGFTSSGFIPLFVGRGRLARHLIHFFQSQNLPYLEFADARRISAEPELFANLALAATHVWLLVSDRALAEVEAQVKRLAPEARILHSSAATRISGASTLHPLMTFSTELYSSEKYRRIPWIAFDDEPRVEVDFAEVTTLPGSMRVRYHAACVMLSNFSQILWGSAESLSPALPAPAWQPILQQSLDNFIAQGAAALTGPLARGDQTTISAHQQALDGLREAELYSSFVRYFQGGARA